MPDEQRAAAEAPKRASATPARVPRMTAPVAATDARSASTARLHPVIWPFDNSAPYHLSVGECAASQTVTRRELLNEKTIIDRIGTYRNTSPNTSAVRENTPRAAHVCASSSRCRDTLEQHDRHHEQQQDQHRHRARHRPVAVLEELVRQHAADHELVGAAEQRRNDVLADRRNEHEQRPGDDAGHRLRQRDRAGTPSAAARPGRRPPRAACRRASRDWRTAAGS